MAVLSEENATGLNPEEAYNNIHDFDVDVYTAGGAICDGCYHLFNELYYVWASPKAVEFNSFKVKMNDVYELVLNKGDIVLYNAVCSYNSMARANGLDTIEDSDGNDFENSYLSGDHTQMLLEMGAADLVAERNGIVGMNILQVEDIILPAFNKKMKRAVELIDSLPDQIALFDTSDNLKNAFKEEVTAMKISVTVLIEEVNNAINEAIETETNNLRLASNPTNGQNA